MKIHELLLLSVYLVAIQLLSFGQTQQSSLPSEVKENTQTLQTNIFRVFTGGINAIYSNDAAKGGIDLSVQTYHYYLVTGTKEIDTASKSGNSTKTSFRQQYNGFEFYLLNRAAMNFDTSRSIANDYITSLQASPLTLRFMKEIFLTKQPENTTTSYAPIISIRLISDGRAIPYEDSRSQISFGASGNFYITLSSQFTRLEFDHSGKEMDRGTMYI